LTFLKLLLASIFPLADTADSPPQKKISKDVCVKSMIFEGIFATSGSVIIVINN
jgi:hypothetical protein